jgi:hypothetical protein
MESVLILLHFLQLVQADILLMDKETVYHLQYQLLFLLALLDITLTAEEIVFSTQYL